MGDEQATPNRQAERAAARGTQSSPDSKPEQVTYTVDQLTENAQQLLGVSRHALAGALHGQTRKTYTLDAATKLVDTFLKRPAEEAS